MHESHYILEFIFFLAAAVVCVPVFKKFRMSSVLGYLCAGFLIGPSVLGLVGDGENVRNLAEFGIVFLLFVIGMELSFERLRLLRRYIFGLGTLQVVLTSLGIGAAGIYFGLDPMAATVIALALALSSTAFVMQHLSERDEQVTQHGRIAFSILLLQDLAIVPILALLPFLPQSDETGNILTAVLGAFGTALAAIVGTIVIGKLVLRPLYRVVANSKSPELFPTVTLLILLGVGAILIEIGISMTLGAFLCGLLVAETEYKHQVESDISPFKGMLMGLFFMTVGIGIDPELIFNHFGLILAILTTMLFFKSTLIAVLCFLFGTPWPIAGRVGMLMAQGGEFAFVILGTSAIFQIVPVELSNILIAVVVLSMIATPFMDFIGRTWNNLFHPIGEAELTDIKRSTGHLNNHVIIGGFGRVGQMAARMLSSQGIPYIALDLDHELAATFRQKEMMVYYGNVTSIPVLRDAHIDDARAVLLTLDHRSQSRHAVEVIKKNFPQVPVISRSKDEKHGQELSKLGAERTVPELIESSFRIGTTLLQTVGVSEDAIADVVQKMRNEVDPEE